MKNLIILITIILSVKLNAQDTIRHWLDTYYYEKENIEIPSLQFEIVNQEILETFEDEIFPRGYVQKVEIQFLEYAKLIRKRDVNVYLLHFFALNSERFSFDMDFAIPENAFIEVVEGADRIVEHLTSKDNYKSDDNESHIRGRNIGGTSNECIIRVEIPKRKVSKAKIHINALFLSFN